MEEYSISKDDNTDQQSDCRFFDSDLAGSFGRNRGVVWYCSSAGLVLKAAIVVDSVICIVEPVVVVEFV